MTFIALVPPVYYNVKMYGAVGDGTTDDTTAIANARSAANSTSGGTVFYPPGTYISGNQTLYSNVYDVGAGFGASIIKLKAGANTDLFSAQTSSINLSQANAAGITGTLTNFGFRDIILDGNKANQTAGPSYCLRFYGYRFIMRDMGIRNGYSGGMLCDWNGAPEIVQPSEQMESTMDNITVHSNNGIGLQMGGPHDSRLSNITSYDNTSHNFHFAPNAIAMLLTQCHPYRMTQSVNAVGMLCEAPSCKFVNCLFEGSDFVQVVILGSDCSIIGGQIFGNVGYTGVGLQIGQQAGLTPIPGQIFQSGGVTTAQAISGTYVATSFRACTNGAINEANAAVMNTYISDVYQASGSAIVSGGGYLNSSTTAILTVRGTTADGSPGKGGTFQLGDGSYNGFVVFDSTSTEIFQINTYAPSSFAVLNGRAFSGYSDAGVTLKMLFDMNTGNITASGNLAVGQSASAPALAASGTIATANLGESRVAPTANVASIVLAAGTVAGQEVSVVNQSAFTITFAASGTSNVADGVSAIIAANRKMDFTWNSANSLWYHS